jgi:dTDP-4-amino-4,6-dideoxygalactose transaminase
VRNRSHLTETNHKIDFAKPTLPTISELSEEIGELLSSGALTKGRHLHDFEQSVAKHLQVKHAIAVSSCTVGLMLVYQALGLEGDVIVPSFTFMATVSALRWCGVRPVFADVDPETLNLDPEAVERLITPETSAIVAVHNFGNPAEVDQLETLAGRYSIPLVLDAAHGFGSLFNDKPLGAQGAAQVFSMSPTKLLVAGEGGVVSTNDDFIAQRVRTAREYGNPGNYDSTCVGLNARLPEFNALLGRYGLRSLEAAAQRRNEIAALYRQTLSHLPGLSFQRVRPGNRSSYTIFSVAVDADAFGITRNELALILSKQKIETRCYYDPPVHRQSAYRQFASPMTDLTKTDSSSASVLCLPIWSTMKDSVVSEVCLAIEQAHEFSGKARKKAAGEIALVG